MPKIFKAVTKNEDALMGELPGKGWRKIVSINTVPGEHLLALAESMNPNSWEQSFNSDLSGLLIKADKKPEKNFEIVVESVEEKRETILVPVVNAAIEDGVKKNFEGIIAVGKAAGLTEDDLAAIFGAALVEFEHTGGDHTNLGGMGMGDMDDAHFDMADMLNQMPNMMQNAAGAPNCEAQ